MMPYVAGTRTAGQQRHQPTGPDLAAESSLCHQRPSDLQSESLG